MPIDPLASVAGYAGRAVAISSAQPRPSVRSVAESARVIVSDILQPRGRTVGVLLATPPKAFASPDGLEGGGGVSLEV